MGNRPEQTLQKRGYPMPNNHLKKFAVLFIIKEMKIKTQLDYRHSHQMYKGFKKGKCCPGQVTELVTVSSSRLRV